MHETMGLSISKFVNSSTDTAPGDDVRHTIAELSADKGRCRLNSEHGARVNDNKDA